MDPNPDSSGSRAAISLWRRRQKDAAVSALLAAWPSVEPVGWLRQVNQAQTKSEVEALRRSVVRGTPFGSQGWMQRTARRLGLESTLRPRGRPRKKRQNEATPAS